MTGSLSLVVREPELARLQELLATVRGGASASLLVRGEPGVGKSALLEQLIASASGFQVVRAVGVEGEVDLPYAGATAAVLGAQLFLSPRTVEWHLRRVYPKLGISSRKALRAALPAAWPRQSRASTRGVHGCDRAAIART